MTTSTWRISPHTDHPHTRLDRLAILADARITRHRLRIPCPAHGGTNSNLALWVNDDGITARCHSAGCSDIAKAIEDRYGIAINPRRYHGNFILVATKATGTKRRAKPQPNPPALPHQPSRLHLNITASQRPLHLSKAHRPTA